MRSVLHILLVLALAGAANLHLPMLQVVAWTGMLASYSQDRSMAEAVEMTFDGEHPCPMCKAIKKQQEQKPDLKCAAQAPSPVYFLHVATPWIQTLDLLDILPVAAYPAPGGGTLPQRMPPRTVA